MEVDIDLGFASEIETATKPRKMISLEEAKQAGVKASQADGNSE
ncbi:MAG: hypothetical protein ACI9UA_005587 [Pseudoalteromonas tetraodonis]